MGTKKILTKIKRILNFIWEIPEAIFAVLLIAIVLLFLYIFDSSKFIQDHFPGLWLDIAVFGVLIVIYQKITDKRREKKNNITRWLEEIDDFRDWKDPEATYRIVGNIYRLNKYDVSEIDLSYCFLKNAFFGTASREKGKVVKVNLKGADLSYADLTNAYFILADLRGAIMKGAILQETYFELSDLSDAKHLTIEQLVQAKTLYMSKLDPQLEVLVKKKHPHLLEEAKQEDGKEE